MEASSDSTQKLSLVYFGSGPLAARSLEFLHQHFFVEAVITKPSPVHHKGPAPVAAFCESNGLRCLMPANKQELSTLFNQEHFTSDLGVVIDYGIIINRDVIDAFPLGIVNSHFSLLPELRGADPITFALLSGQDTTGVSLMLINEQMDEGPLLAQAEVPITANTNIFDLTDELTEGSNALLLEMLPLYVEGVLQPVPQTSTISKNKVPSYSRKLTKADGVLDWNKPADQLEREIRAYLEWPKSRTTLGDIEVIITHARTAPATNPHDPGFLEVSTGDGKIAVHTSTDCLIVERLKPAGKKEMSVAEFVRGYGARLRMP
jgi:methionyl-tRNA formyltransferase